MARTKVNVDLVQLATQINALEAKQKFNGFSELFAALAETEWAKQNNYSAPILRARTIEANLEIVTTKGKPGRKAVKSAQVETPQTAEVDNG